MSSHYVAEIERLRKENETLRDTIAMKDARLAQRRSRNHGLSRRVQELEAQLAARSGKPVMLRGKRILIREARP